MSNEKLIRIYFDFLKHNGYKRKLVSRNGDVEIAYYKKELTLEISCELGVSSVLPFAAKIDEILNTSLYMISVIIKYGYQRKNILYCELFDYESRMILKSKIENAKNDTELVLKEYSQFIQDNIDRLE